MRGISKMDEAHGARFESGDVVRLRSGGQPMTITCVWPASAELEVVWMAPDGRLQHARIPAATVERDGPEIA